VLDHLARHGRDRTGALRLAAIGCLATLVAIGLARGAEAMAGQLGWDPAAALAFIGSALARLWPGG